MRSEPEKSGIEAERHAQKLQAALRREERISQALRAVGIALGSTLDLDDLLELILQKLTELVEADRSTLYLLDEANRELVSRLVVGGEVRSIRMKVGHGLAGTVAQTGAAIRVREAYADERFERDWDSLTGYRTTSVLAAPLKNHVGRTIGVIQVLNKKSGDGFTDEDEAIVSALSTQAAVAIDNSRLFLSLIQKNKQLSDTMELLERRVRDLSLLFDLERSTARTATVEDLARAALTSVMAACGAGAGALSLAAEETGDLVAYVLEADQGAELRRIGVKSGEGLMGHVLATGEPLTLENAVSDPRFSPQVEGRLSFQVESMLAVPLEGDEAQMGALALFHRVGQRFGEEDFEILRLVAANVSTAVRLYNARTAREIGERLTAVGRLLSQVIHDFKAPMTVISGYAQLMAEADDRAQRQAYCEDILRQFDTLSEMQREVLEFARGESKIFVRKVYLRKFFLDLTRQIQLEIGDRPIELKVEVDSKLVARFDEGRMTRALHNLGRNAIEAMGDAGGELTISAGFDGEDLVIQVGDTGPGIPPEIEHRLFQSFVTAGKTGGTGLGLAIVRKIAEEHGGDVRVSSSPRGASFELRLPQVRPRSDKSPRKPRSRSSPRVPVPKSG